MMDGRTEIEFESGGAICRAWHYRPASEVLTKTAGTPCLVMANGFAATRDSGLEPFAQRFAAAGLNVLVFDYRHFGASDGEPRHLVTVPRQLQDWEEAIRYARTLPGIDPDRIALWGTSFSGGHVIAAAVRDGRIAAISAQAPSMDGQAIALNVLHYAGLGQVARLMWAGLKDLARAATGRPPHRIPVAGKPGSLAGMTTHDALSGYLALTPPGWRNEYCARINVTVGVYRPGRTAHKLRCPILIQVCKRDSIAPPAAAADAARRAGGLADYREYDTGHFGLYSGQGFERAVSDQIEFFLRHLGPERTVSKLA